MMNDMVKKQIEQIYSATSKIDGLYGTWAKKHGLNYNSLMILYAVESNEECTQKDICEKWLIPKQTVNTILNDYKNKGYIVLVTADNNRKEKIIQLTNAGKQYSDTILPKLHQAEERVMLSMGPKACQELVNTTIMFCDLFEQEVNHE